MPRYCGYAHVVSALKLPAHPLRQPASEQPVSRLLHTGDGLFVPRAQAPQDDSILTHLLFAIRHEGINLQILSQALLFVDAESLLHELRRKPTGAWIRRACLLWEHFTGRRLEGIPSVGNRVVPMFDPARYVTRRARSDPRWRVQFNGLGTLDYCVSVFRTPAIEAALAARLPDQVQQFAASLDGRTLERALNWAFLHETRDSFAIERENPSEERTHRFVELMRGELRHATSLSEAALTAWQNEVVANPYVLAGGFRTRQNWLGGPGQGALGVTYVPPPPALLGELMPIWMALASRLPTEIDPIVAASVSSFAFVFMHPFMDGNGRLSRFLFQKALRDSGQFPSDLLLPVSVAMKRNEAEYLSALQSYSRPLREYWRVNWVDQDDFEFTFTGVDALYRYWDATECVEFGYRMAAQALETDLRAEVHFIDRYDAIVRALDERFDVVGSDLSMLVVACLDHGGIVSRHRRKQFAGRVPDALFDELEKLAQQSPEPTG